MTGRYPVEADLREERDGCLVSGATRAAALGGWVQIAAQRLALSRVRGKHPPTMAADKEALRDHVGGEADPELEDHADELRAALQAGLRQLASDGGTCARSRPSQVLHDPAVVRWFLDPSIVFRGPRNPINTDPLLINIGSAAPVARGTADATNAPEGDPSVPALTVALRSS